jgi:hypothetical protein
VDEFRTTKIHYRDDSLLQKVMKRNGRKDGRLVAVRGLLWCCSTIKGESKFVNRDVNAATSSQHHEVCCSSKETRYLGQEECNTEA